MNYKNDLHQQEVGKKQRGVAERQQDKLYAQLESAQQSKNELSRK